MEEKEGNPFEPQKHRFGELFKDFIFYEFLRSSFEEGKPSEFLLKTSRHLHEKKLFFEEDDLKNLNDVIKTNEKELYEVLKALNPELLKEEEVKEKR